MTSRKRLILAGSAGTRLQPATLDISIEEEPEKPKSPFVVTGTHYYDQQDVEIVKALKANNTRVAVYDPSVDLDEADYEYGLVCLPEVPAAEQYGAIVLAVGHKQFVELGEADIKAWGHSDAALFDVKSILPRGVADGRP